MSEKKDRMHLQYFFEVGVYNVNKNGKFCCGDTFMSRKMQEENRLVCVLSDGLGSGVRANILSTMTASMALNFCLRNEPVVRTANIIKNTLPIDSSRNISYSTFTIADVDALTGTGKVVEYDNPPFLLIRNGKVIDVDKELMDVDYTFTDEEHPPVGNVYISHINFKPGDRLIMFSDGVVQSGMGISSANMPFGWGVDGIAAYAEKVIAQNSTISAQDLAHDIVTRAVFNDGYKSKDDITCACVYIRSPRRLLLCSGPPFDEAKDKYLGDVVRDFDGKKIICGGTTSKIISRQLNEPIEVPLTNLSPDMPPASIMKGIDLITEGILTLGKLNELLERKGASDIKGNKTPAHDIFNLLMQSDCIHFLIGTKINEAHQDPSLPVELEIRRNVIKRIEKQLEEKFLKEVHVEFI